MLPAEHGFQSLLQLGVYGGGDGAEDRSLTCALGEDDDPHGVRRCVRGGGQGEFIGFVGEIFQAADVLHGSDDACVLEAVAAVLAAADVGGIFRVDQGGVEVS